MPKAASRVGKLAMWVLVGAGLCGAQTTAPPELDTMSLEELMNVKVYTASKYLQSSSDAPSSMTVITGEQIRTFAYRTLAEILASVPGFYANYDRNYSYLGVRGFARPGDYNTRVLLLIDNQRVNDPVYDMAPLGTEFPVDVDLIERVEVVRGPGSSVYGTSAFFAVVNVITRSPRRARKLEGSGEFGSFGSVKGRLTFTGRIGREIDALISASAYDSHGAHRLYYPEFDTPETNHGVAIDADADRLQQVFTRALWRNLGLTAAYGAREKRVPTASFGTVFGQREQTTDHFGLAGLEYTHRSPTSELTARLSYGYYWYDGASVYRYDGGMVANRDFVNSEWLRSEVTFLKRFGDRQRLTAGVELQGNLRQRLLNYDVDPYTRYADIKDSSSVSALHAQDEWRITSEVSVTAGARLDLAYDGRKRLSPRTALIVKPTDRTTIKFLYGSAFRAANSYEQNYYPDAQRQAPRLLPETVNTIELSAEHQFRTNTRVSASVFQSGVNDLISQVAKSGRNVYFANANDEDSKGVELALDGYAARVSQYHFSYTVQVARDAASGALLSNSPRHLAKLRFAVPLRNLLTFAADSAYMSRRRDIMGGSIGGFPLVNLTVLSNRLSERVEVSGSIYNLFDKRHADPGAEDHMQLQIPQDGRTFRLKLIYRF